MELCAKSGCDTVGGAPWGGLARSAISVYELSSSAQRMLGGGEETKDSAVLVHFVATGVWWEKRCRRRTHGDRKGRASSRTGRSHSVFLAEPGSGGFYGVVPGAGYEWREGWCGIFGRWLSLFSPTVASASYEDDEKPSGRATLWCGGEGQTGVVAGELRVPGN